MTLEVSMFVKNVEIVLNKRGEIYFVFRLIKSIIWNRVGKLERIYT